MPITRRDFLTLCASLPLAAGTVDAACVWGVPVWHPEPVLWPTEPWEAHCAMPFSDGCWWDPARDRFRLWYMAGYVGGTALAESRDGYAWTKLGLIDPTRRDSSTVWRCPDGLYARGSSFLGELSGALTLQTSPDGIAWTTVGRTPPCGDRSTIYRLPDGRWILSGRCDDAGGRMRCFFEAEDLTAPWTPIETNMTHAGEPDPPNDPPSQLYNFDAAPFEGRMLGLIAIWTGDRPPAPKKNDLTVAMSADGLQWDRGPRPWIARSDDPLSWRFGNVQSCGGVWVALTPDRIGFYVSARSGTLADQHCVTGLVTMDRATVCG